MTADFKQMLRIQPSPITDVWELTQSCLEQLGSPDPELRDELIYASLAQWILENEHVDKRQLETLLKICFDGQHRFFSAR